MNKPRTTNAYRICTLGIALASCAHAVRATPPTYARYTLDSTVHAPVYAGTVDILEESYILAATTDEGSRQCESACTKLDTCVGFLWQHVSNRGACITLKVGTDYDRVKSGFDLLAWRYDARSGPTCNSLTDHIADWSGQCLCGPNSAQNTPFGCSITSELQRRQAPIFSYAEFPLGPTDNPVYAGTLNSLGTQPIQGASADAMAQRCREICSGNSACIAFLLKVNNARLGTCTMLAVGTQLTQLGQGYTRVGWKYDAEVGPRCTSGLDSIPDVSGQCICGSYILQEQDGPFGCALRLAPPPGPSQAAALRRRATRSLIMPGIVRNPSFAGRRDKHHIDS